MNLALLLVELRIFVISVSFMVTLRGIGLHSGFQHHTTKAEAMLILGVVDELLANKTCLLRLLHIKNSSL